MISSVLAVPTVYRPLKGRPRPLSMKKQNSFYDYSRCLVDSHKGPTPTKLFRFVCACDAQCLTVYKQMAQHISLLSLFAMESFPSSFALVVASCCSIDAAFAWWSFQQQPAQTHTDFCIQTLAQEASNNLWTVSVHLPRSQGQVCHSARSAKHLLVSHTHTHWTAYAHTYTLWVVRAHYTPIITFVKGSVQMHGLWGRGGKGAIVDWASEVVWEVRDGGWQVPEALDGCRWLQMTILQSSKTKL